jgi:hypothetical protein
MEPVAPSIRLLAELFATRPDELRFPDVDVEVLATCMQDVVGMAEAVLTAEASLSAARAALQDAQELLLQKAQRALAYVRVYAEADPALNAQIAVIALPRPTKRGGTEAVVQPAESPVKRRRRRVETRVTNVASVPESELPFDAVAL